jgi:hypothetical protein
MRLGILASTRFVSPRGWLWRLRVDTKNEKLCHALFSTHVHSPVLLINDRPS